ncbi:hypothetical protein PR202_ga00131 [Eleusine coracana subsp. coracana]|uniref:Dirigent protein n=1 Tax=Eleusine coracana subsp. coracana TaxID=191504 RepID=A0AAV5BEA9_ELECO|nr:hypothetical protein QOZ80_2AG0123180 [Eleusine coracana subsp. coracana]GJM84461.1 hypothetical protein PR202_ga00131 [Eleusine coracana subsp. coracana]
MASLHGATVLLPPLLLFSLLFFPSADAAGAGGDGRPTHLHFYFHELYTGGPNGTTAQLAPARGGTNNASFGMAGVVDDMLRDGADPSSRLIGHAQGLTVGSSLSDGALTTELNFLFTDGAARCRMDHSADHLLSAEYLQPAECLAILR